ncbi:PREDICTED: uncharacterized protein LOC109289081 [Gavialis gangeticus]|uniref:uncharacterized protein LOC109289081 n=1 Tax=Gavialis gangeticus TaxID=94835 RepID=UPI00092F421D|nr:PREDICTED: uncharacterized protein LOC109289081 [Gavialis gangeticus]
MKDLLTTRNQDCWKELIEKELFSRVGWNTKYGHKFPRLQPCSGPKRKCFLPTIFSPREQEEGNQGEGTGFKKNGIRHQERQPKDVSLPRKQEEGVQEPLLPEMRPASPGTMRLLYQGISWEGKGRHLYLQERKQKSPEDKFSYPVLSSWEYGWRLGGFVTEGKAPMHAKSRIVRDTFYIKNGIFHHPSKSDKLS